MLATKMDVIQVNKIEITIHEVETKKVCRLLIPEGDSPTFVDGDFYARNGTQKRKLNPVDAAKYQAVWCKVKD